MGWCYEFGPQIGEHCDHPMVAGERSCTCSACGAVCTGRFTGCSEVWARRQTTSVVELPHRPAVLRFVEREGDGANEAPIDAALVRSSEGLDPASGDQDRS